MTGWYLMHRGWMASPDFKPEPFTEPQAFLWSIEQAAHAPHVQWFNGVQYPVDRGEFVTSLRQMMAAFRWSEKRVRGFRERMVKARKWAKRGANAGAKCPTVLTVCNYAIYQAPAKRKGEAGEEAKGELGAKQGRSEGEEQKEFKSNSNEGERIEKASPARAPARPYADAIARWSDAAALKGWEPVAPKMPLNDKRQRGLGRVLDAYGLDGWTAGLQRAVDSPLLGGPDPPGWFHLTFVCNLDNFTKLYEGNYDRSFDNHSSKSGESPWLAARAQLRGAPDSASPARCAQIGEEPIPHRLVG